VRHGPTTAGGRPLATAHLRCGYDACDARGMAEPCPAGLPAKAPPPSLRSPPRLQAGIQASNDSLRPSTASTKALTEPAPAVSSPKVRKEIPIPPSGPGGVHRARCTGLKPHTWDGNGTHPLL